MFLFFYGCLFLCSLLLSMFMAVSVAPRQACLIMPMLVSLLTCTNGGEVSCRAVSTLCIM